MKVKNNFVDWLTAKRGQGMAGEWMLRPFGELLATPLKNGLTKPTAVRGSGVKMVNMGELFAHPRIGDVPMERVPLSPKEAETYLLEKGDLLFARQSLVLSGAGKCSVFLGSDEPVTYEGHLIRARLDARVADSQFFYYYFGSTNGRNAIESIIEQVAAAGIRGSDLARLLVACPPPAEQRVIAHILGTLDDKIELNRRMNATLEAMARALFKAWFVDFDPVRAKAEGRDTGLPREIADLFPDGFEESAVGEVPVGWRVGSLGEVAEHPRRTVQPGKIDAATPYIALEHMPRRCIALSDWGEAAGLESNKFEFKKGDILFGKLRPYFHKVGIAPVDGVCSTDIVVVTPRAEEWFGFVLGHVSSDAFVEHTNTGSTGTKMPRTSWDQMARYAVVLPPLAVAEAFTEQIQPAIERILASIYESRTLAALRDTLLPKLISGAVRVGDVERFVGAAQG
jgi:type I restriction enzyme, S subunit